ncbi:hypothetical protein PROFUN_03368 [Planoprotostelium fungivorum]|uniref:Uncharacterized protein n=1 Tax=Planoprotostelium fungivorum TaxID=1890364 RepID=A0A2P6NWD0_9EUKA|nr:hypothetical protein PROFUN_03368 [Planoprotostelium fungivorum]
MIYNTKYGFEAFRTTFVASIWILSLTLSQIAETFSIDGEKDKHRHLLYSEDSSPAPNTTHAHARISTQLTTTKRFQERLLMKHVSLLFVFIATCLAGQITSPTAGLTLVSSRTYTFSYQSTSSPSGNVWIAQFGGVVVSDGGFQDGHASFNYTVTADHATGPSNLTWIEEFNGYGPASPPNQVTTQTYYVLSAEATTSAAPATHPTATTGQRQGGITSSAVGDTLFTTHAYTFTYTSHSSPSGNVYIAMFGGVVISDGALSGGEASFTYTVRSDQPAGLTNFTIIEEFNGYGPSSPPNQVTTKTYWVYAAASSISQPSHTDTQCTGHLKKCGQQCYDPANYKSSWSFSTANLSRSLTADIMMRSHLLLSFVVLKGCPDMDKERIPSSRFETSRELETEKRSMKIAGGKSSFQHQRPAEQELASPL